MISNTDHDSCSLYCIYVAQVSGPCQTRFTGCVKIQLFLQQPTINLMPVFRQPKNNRNSGGDYALNLLNIKSRQDKPYPYFNTCILGTKAARSAQVVQVYAYV